jgi:protein gp37
MNSTSIEWCNRPETRGLAGAKTWNPIVASIHCPACEHHHKSRRGCGQPVTRHGEPDVCHCPVGAHTIGTFCTRISPGCTHCYASTINKRFGNGLEFTVPNLEKIEFFIDERILAEPLKQKKPCTIFVGDMFDLFHEAIPQIMIAQVLWTAVQAKWHTFQFLTKRAERMMNEFKSAEYGFAQAMPPHIWAGVSVEDQQRACERIPFLQGTPAAVRFLSVEPQLEEVRPALREISWVICGGESGQQARPMHPNWARSLRDQCQAANVSFFFKQWGEWQPHPDPPDRNGDYHGGLFLLPTGKSGHPLGNIGNQGDWWEGRAQAMDRVGKKKAGAMLDGREWREFP